MTVFQAREAATRTPKASQPTPTWALCAHLSAWSSFSWPPLLSYQVGLGVHLYLLYAVDLPRRKTRAPKSKNIHLFHLTAITVPAPLYRETPITQPSDTGPDNQNRTSNVNRVCLDPCAVEPSTLVPPPYELQYTLYPSRLVLISKTGLGPGRRRHSQNALNGVSV